MDLTGDFFHFAPQALKPGAIIYPGNWGRIICHTGWTHKQALRETALEESRLRIDPSLPSRLLAAFAFPSLPEARWFAANHDGYQGPLHRVSLVETTASSYVGQVRLSSPIGTVRPFWADNFWTARDMASANLPGVHEQAPVRRVYCRELVTHSPLRVEECLDI